jgi:hypothetical protein
MKKFALLLACVLFLGSFAQANVIRELVPFVNADGGEDDPLGAGSIYGFVIEGTTCYVQVSLNSVPQINRVDNLPGPQEVTRLVSPAQWLAATGKTIMTTFYGLDLIGDWIIFSDVASDCLWHCNKNTGELIKWVDKGTITNTAGTGNANLLAYYTVDRSNGNIIFKESVSDNIMIATGSNQLSILVSYDDLIDEFGNDGIHSGLTVGPDGGIYWGNNTSDILVKYETNVTFTIVYEAEDISEVTGTNAVAFSGDVFYAPDGNIYFSESATDNVMRFDPADPDNTLEIYLTGTEIAESVAGSSQTSSMGWYKGGLCWHRFQRNGIYWADPIPEPGLAATILLLGIGLLYRRR